jgi:hypothetical protein
VVGTVAVLAIASVAVFMGVAFAHHPILGGDTVCTNGDHEITWTITNSESNKVMDILGATATMDNGAHTYPVTDYSTPLGPSGNTLATTIVPGAITGVVTLTVDAYWSDGKVYATRMADVSLLSTCTGGATTAPTTAPPTTGPPTTDAPTTVPEWTVPQSTVPESTVPASTVPESTVPESTTIMTLGSTATTATTIPEGTTAEPTTVAAAGSTVTTGHSTDTTGRVAQSGAQQQNQLPFTGSDGWPPVIGLMALALGGVLLFISGRRNLRRS